MHRIVLDKRLVVILLLALLLRFYYWYTMPYQTLTFAYPAIGDEPYYYYSAVSVAEGKGYLDQYYTYIRPPLYILFLAGIFKLLGPDIHLAKLFNVFLDLINVYMVYLIAQTLFCRRVGLIAALFYALCASFAAYGGILMSETFYILLYNIVFLLLAKLAATEHPWATRNLFFLGVSMGLAALARSWIITFMPLLILWLFMILKCNFRLCARYVAIILVACLAVISPWTLRNYQKYHQFILIDTVGPYMFMMAATGMDLTGTSRELDKVGQNQGDKQAYAIHEGLESIRCDPSKYLGSLYNKFMHFWQLRFVVYEYAFQDSPLWDILLAVFLGDGLYVIAMVLGLWGLFYSGQHNFKWLFALWMSYLAVVAALLTSNTRFRLSFLPLLFVYAAYTVANWKEIANNLLRTKNGIGAILLALLIIGLLIQPAYPQAVSFVATRQYYITLGRLYSSWGTMEQAAAAYRQAAEMDPQYAEAHIALGNVLRSHGLLEEAIWEYQQGLAILQHSNPGDARLSAAYAHAYLGMAYLEQGKPDLAAREFAADPGMMDGLTDWAWSNLGPVPTSFIDVGNLDLGYVRGFHGRESDGDLSYRWSEGTAFIKFLHVKGGSLKLSLRLSGWRLGEAPPARVSILANGRLLTDFVAPKEMRTYEFIITEPTFTSDDLTIEIRSSTFVAGEGDTRALGVIVDWAKVEELNGG